MPKNLLLGPEFFRCLCFFCFVTDAAAVVVTFNAAAGAAVVVVADELVVKRGQI